jgi:hypothetical protein
MVLTANIPIPSLFFISLGQSFLSAATAIGCGPFLLCFHLSPRGRYLLSTVVGFAYHFGDQLHKRFLRCRSSPSA